MFYIVFICVCFIGLVNVLILRSERKLWNGGFCRCGGMFYTHDSDSCGCNLHKCNRCGRTLRTTSRYFRD